MIVFFLAMSSSTFFNDIQMAVVSLLSGDRYRLLAFNDWAWISSTPRELWGKRYNLLVNSLLRESVFTPLRTQAKLSASQAALGSFIVSGLLHLHVAKVGFNGDHLISSFSFFLIQGMACTFQDTLGWNQLPRPISILATNALILLSYPLYPGLFLYQFPSWFRNNPAQHVPPFHLPIPDYCPSLKSN